MGNDNIKVSICCMAYNHEKYIRQCLDSFVMQKCDFIFEVIINDDASTDHTADIIKEYEERYPDIIKPVYQTINQYSQGKNIVFDIMLPIASGEYIALCEGDDYWLDVNKLQKQYDLLESNMQCSACFNRTVVAVDENSQIRGYCPSSNIESGVMMQKKYFDYLSYDFFHWCSMFFRRNVYEVCEEELMSYSKITPGLDYLLAFVIGKCGDVYYTNDCMSFHRWMSDNSYTVRNSSVEKGIEKNNRLICFAKKFDVDSNKQFHKSIKKYINGRVYKKLKLNGEVLKLFKIRYRFFLTNDYSLIERIRLICRYVRK